MAQRTLVGKPHQGSSSTKATPVFRMNGDTWLETGFPVQTWTLKEVAVMLKIHPETLRQECVRRGIGVKVMGRWRLARYHIDALMETPCSEKEAASITTTFRSVENDFEALLAQATG